VAIITSSWCLCSSAIFAALAACAAAASAAARSSSVIARSISAVALPVLALNSLRAWFTASGGSASS
jgi:hypothetical protein